MNKRHNSYEKNGTQQICRSLWNKEFRFSIFLPYLVYFGGKIESLIFTKTFFMVKTRTVDQKWLVISFWTLKKCAKAQSNPIVLRKVIVFTDNDNRQISS